MKGMTIAGFICGIAALVLAWFGLTSLIALPLAIVGLVLSVKGGKAYQAAGTPNGLAKAGLIIGIIAVVLTAITFFTCGICYICATCAVNSANNAANSIIAGL